MAAVAADSSVMTPLAAAAAARARDRARHTVRASVLLRASVRGLGWVMAQRARCSHSRSACRLANESTPWSARAWQWLAEVLRLVIWMLVSARGDVLDRCSLSSFFKGVFYRAAFLRLCSIAKIPFLRCDLNAVWRA